MTKVENQEPVDIFNKLLIGLNVPFKGSTTGSPSYHGNDGKYLTLELPTSMCSLVVTTLAPLPFRPKVIW